MIAIIYSSTPLKFLFSPFSEIFYATIFFAYFSIPLFSNNVDSYIYRTISSHPDERATFVRFNFEPLLQNILNTVFINHFRDKNDGKHVFPFFRFFSGKFWTENISQNIVCRIAMSQILQNGYRILATWKVRTKKT